MTERSDLSFLVKSFKFTDPISLLNELRCNFCQNICVEALTATCGHLFCSECLNGPVKKNVDGPRNDLRCPVDDVPIVKGQMKENEKMRKKVDNLNVQCPFRSNGCNDVVKLQYITRHVKSCDKATIKCPQGCKRLVGINDLQNHLRFVCTHRTVTCDFCKQDFVLAFEQNHLSDCQQMIVDCPNRCGKEGIIRAEIPEHLKVCQIRLFPCKYEHLGCDFRGNGKNLEEHESDMLQHFKLMADLYSFLNLQFDILMQESKGDILLLQNENYAFRHGMKEILKQFDRLRETNDGLMEKVANLQVYVHKLFTMHETGLKESSEDKERSADVESTTDGHETHQKSLAQELKENNILIDMVHDLKLRVDRQELEIQTLSINNHDGVLVWKINDYRHRKAESMSGRHPSMVSEPFFTDRYGYKMCSKVFLGGDGDGRGSHLSVFVCIMKGPWDDILSWPFKRKVTIVLIDQKNPNNKENIKEAFLPNHTLGSFQKPQTDINVGSGISKFAPHALVEECDKYLINDTIYLKITVGSDGREKK